MWGQIAETQTMAQQAICIAEEIRDILRDQAERQGGTEHVQFTRRSLVIQTDATGAGSMTLDMRAGVDLHLIGYSGVCSAANTGAILFYLDQGQDPTSLFAVGELSQFFSDSFSEGDQIPDSRDLCVTVVGGPPSGQVIVNVSAKIVTYKYPGA